MEARIEHWKFYDGWHYTIAVLRTKPDNKYEYNPDLFGWHCWAYPSNNTEFETWCESNLSESADVCLRFNGGDMMYTVVLKDKNDADKFATQFNLRLV